MGKVKSEHQVVKEGTKKKLNKWKLAWILACIFIAMIIFFSILSIYQGTFFVNF